MNPGNQSNSSCFLVSWLPDFLLIFSCVPAFLINSSSAADVVIGSKKFTESYVLGEIAKRTLTDAGIPAEHRQGMGGTIILWEALRGGQIDAYPEYTGTIATEILKSDSTLSLDQIRNSLEKVGVGMTAPLGFNNTYALVMRRSEAQRLGIRTISDLQRYPELKFGLTHEFLERQDGWRPLRQRYGLPQQNIIGIDHALGYSALANGSIAVKDAYSTDAKIEQNDLVVLEDDLHFFPKYEAVFLFRSSTRADAIAALRRLEGTLDEKRMIRLNAEAERTKNYARAADLYFEGGARGVEPQQPSELTILFRTSWRAGHFAISSWLDFRCCFQSSSGFRLALSRVAAVLLAMLFLVSPALCKQFRRSRCSPCLFPCPFLESAFALRSLRFFFTVCCRSCATPRPVCRTFHDHCANPRSRWDSAQSRASGKFICRWRRARFSPESKPAP